MSWVLNISIQSSVVQVDCSPHCKKQLHSFSAKQQFRFEAPQPDGNQGRASSCCAMGVSYLMAQLCLESMPALVIVLSWYTIAKIAKNLSRTPSDCPTPTQHTLLQAWLAEKRKKSDDFQSLYNCRARCRSSLKSKTRRLHKDSTQTQMGELWCTVGCKIASSIVFLFIQIVSMYL